MNLFYYNFLILYPHILIKNRSKIYYYEKTFLYDRNYPLGGRFWYVPVCNQRPKVRENKVTNSKGQTGTVEAEVFDAVKLKDQLVDIIKSAPKPAELVDFHQ